ncbi:hypothetical protein ILYODFUR_022598, partial [Ilyodon furcidens]
QEQAGPSETQRTQPPTTSLEPLSSSLRIAMGKVIILKGQRAGPGCTLRAVRFARSRKGRQNMLFVDLIQKICLFLNNYSVFVLF